MHVTPEAEGGDMNKRVLWMLLVLLLVAELSVLLSVVQSAR
jgi:hypothetical protein